MAEISIVASIIGVAGAGFRLSLILNAISCEIAQAPLEIHQISKTVTLFSLMLKQTGTVLQTADSVHSSEAVDAAKQIADESKRVFDEINDMLDRVGSKKGEGSLQPSARQRIKWCFKKSRINYLLAQLESLKLSLCLMLQVLQLGRMMASTRKSDPPEMVKDKLAAIQQERAETQNTLIVRYMQITETNRFFQKCEEDDSAPPSPLEYRYELDNDSQVTVKPPPEYSSIPTLTKLPLYSLGDVDEMLHELNSSSRDMVRVSDQAIDPLLEKWTRWYQIREQRHAKPTGRYTPSVHSLQEDEIPYFESYSAREESPRGYYLEGHTTDWRKPNSAVARQEYARRRKQYAGYQPSISAHSSDQEDSAASNASSKRNTKRHVINSSSESDESEVEISRKPTVKFQPGPPLERKVSSQTTPVNATPPGQQMPPRMPPSPAHSTNSKPSLSPHYMLSTPPAPQPTRPYATPDQNPYYHHSASMPMPPVHTHNAPSPYSPNSPNSPSSYSQNQLGYYGSHGGPPQSRQYVPASNRMSAPRPISRDGKGGHSPSRLSQEMPRDWDWDSDRDRDQERDRYRERDRDYSRRERKYKGSKSKALREGATKGLLGGLGIAGFLEAIGGLDI